MPVDGGLAPDRATLVGPLDRMRVRMAIPVHWFGRGTLEAVPEAMGRDAGHAAERPGDSGVVVTLATLPGRPAARMPEPRFLSGEEG